MILPAGENKKKMKTGPVDRMNVEAKPSSTATIVAAAAIENKEKEK